MQVNTDDQYQIYKEKKIFTSLKGGVSLEIENIGSTVKKIE